MSEKRRRIIYAFPHAGASASLYRPFVNATQAGTDAVLCPMEIPGRGALIKQPEIGDLGELAGTLAQRIVDDVREREKSGPHELVTFGHSFGGVLSVAATDVLARCHGVTPLFSVVSASIAPCVQVADDQHRLTDDQIIEKARNDNATPEAVLRDPALARRVVAQLRADYVIRSQYPGLRDMVVAQPLVLLVATDDPHVPLPKMQAWERHTSAGTSVVEIEGDHFTAYRNWDVVRTELLRDADREDPRRRELARMGQR